MHSETPDRYERLTSVSSSVDFDQRDNVRAALCVCVCVFPRVYLTCVFLAAGFLLMADGHLQNKVSIIFD